MREFKFHCPVCSQNIKASVAQSGSTMECPTCFQRIIVPAAPESNDPSYIVTATRTTERKLPVGDVRARSGSPNRLVGGKSAVMPLVIGLVVIFLGAGGFLLGGRFSKSGPSSETRNNADPPPASQASPAPSALAAAPVGGNSPLPPDLSSGRVGIGTWDTFIAVSNIVVTSGGQVLYTSDFSGGRPKNWIIGSGKWVFFNGVMEQLALGQGNMAVVGEDTWSHYVYKAQVAKLGGAEGFLVLFNFKNVNNYVRFDVGGWGNTAAAVQVIEDGNVTSGPQMPFSVKQNQWYSVELDVNGNNVRCYIDGQLIMKNGD
jgi:hypothetical protein